MTFNYTFLLFAKQTLVTKHFHTGTVLTKKFNNVCFNKAFDS